MHILSDKAITKEHRFVHSVLARGSLHLSGSSSSIFFPLKMSHTILKGIVLPKNGSKYVCDQQATFILFQAHVTFLNTQMLKIGEYQLVLCNENELWYTSTTRLIIVLLLLQKKITSFDLLQDLLHKVVCRLSVYLVCMILYRERVTKLTISVAGISTANMCSTAQANTLFIVLVFLCYISDHVNYCSSIKHYAKTFHRHVFWKGYGNL